MYNERKITGLATGLLVLIAMIAAACGGGSNDGSVDVSPGEPGKLNCAALNQLKSYRYKTHTKRDLAARPPGAGPEKPRDNGPTAFVLTIDTEASTRVPDKTEAIVRFPDNPGTPDLRIIIVGTQAWTNVEDRGWGESNQGPHVLNYPPTLLCDNLAPDIDVSSVVAQPETVNGIATQHYHLDNLPSDFAGRLWDPASDPGLFVKQYAVDLWLAAGGYPVRFDMKGSGKYENGRVLTVEAGIELSGINDNSIKIEAPKVGS